MPALRENLVAQKSGTVTIANGQTVSSAFDARGFSSFGLAMPAAFTGTTLTFQVSHDNSTFQTLRYPTGSPVSMSVAASNSYSLPAPLGAWRYFKIVAGSAQAAERSFTIIATAADLGLTSTQSPEGVATAWVDTQFVNTGRIYDYELEFTRPNNTTTYAAYDFIGNGDNVYGYEITNVTANPGDWFRLCGLIGVKSNPQTANATIGYRFYTKQPTQTQTDNSPVNIPYADTKNTLGSGSINLNAPGTTGSANTDGQRWATNSGIMSKTDTTNSIWVIIEARSAYVPLANEQFYFRFFWQRL